MSRLNNKINDAYDPVPNSEPFICPGVIYDKKVCQYKDENTGEIISKKELSLIESLYVRDS